MIICCSQLRLPSTSTSHDSIAPSVQGAGRAEAFVCSYPLFYSKMRSNTGSSALTSSSSQYTRVHNSWILLSCSYHDNLPALSQPQPVSIFTRLRETPRPSSRICSLHGPITPSARRGHIAEYYTAQTRCRNPATRKYQVLFYTFKTTESAGQWHKELLII